ncbi:AraC family transcriptional regulator [Actinokineospora globicatena]|uniref:AraC family transcriptional regulator n=1 Tax=Actinokineospora globicatena TaxID=103729 RepID=UPI0024A337E7|nr:AraC family transcriptional regulator [Actinokineospora globicatena]MCP2305868.1 AraC-type DNA-binding protein [Actinokineospora globicatena]GLW80263.1 AraC family transcriptional regulator [Actinokineospora globicatena]GLW87092.1 AraC family transcriptional regulator [Actinokineospora globicatena]
MPSSPTRDLPESTDLLGEVLHLLRLTGTLYCRAELTAPWGVDVPDLPEYMILQVVTSGEAWLEVADGEQVRLPQGSLTLLPHGSAHRLRSAPDAAVEPLFDLEVTRVSDLLETMTYGGGGAPSQVTYAVMRFDHVAAQRLLAQLPTVLYLRSLDDDWVHSTLNLITREAATPRPGGETVLTRLADVLVIQSIRAWLDTAPEARLGWLAALRDPHIGRALLAIHRAPEHPWTVATLATTAGMSRSTFSARFTTLVGEPPMHYLATWRLGLARLHLATSPAPLHAIARRYGYTSEAAFCRAFKRTFGTSPGAARQPMPLPGQPS